MHHYPSLTKRQIARMTLREIRAAANDIPFVNPLLGEGEADTGDKASPGAPQNSDSLDDYGALEM